MDVDLALLRNLLVAIETEMCRLDYWEIDAPDPRALNSTLPFSYDTLKFSQWMQFVFLKRMYILAENQHTLPASCNISPYAEEAFKTLDEDTSRLLVLIRNFDALFVTTSSV